MAELAWIYSVKVSESYKDLDMGDDWSPACHKATILLCIACQDGEGNAIITEEGHEVLLASL